MKRFYLLALSAASLMAQPLTSSAPGMGNVVTTDVEYVPVTRSEPIYSTYNRSVPREVCQDEQVPVQQSSGGSNVIGGLVGAAIGGVLGNQIGAGSGKVAATIGGAAVGTMIGQNADKNTQTSYQTVRRCYTQYDTQTDNVVTGYMNYAKFHGRDIAKASKEPLKEIRVTNSFSF